MMACRAFCLRCRNAKDAQMSLWQQLLTSKKFTAMVIGIAATFLATRFGLDEAATQEVMKVIIAYIIGQGIADHGKEAVKEEAAA